MKCNNCKQEIEECDICGDCFEDGNDILCMFSGEHICDLECLFERMQHNGDGCHSKVIK